MTGLPDPSLEMEAVQFTGCMIPEFSTCVSGVFIANSAGSPLLESVPATFSSLVVFGPTIPVLFLFFRLKLNS